MNIAFRVVSAATGWTGSSEIGWWM